MIEPASDANEKLELIDDANLERKNSGVDVFKARYIIVIINKLKKQSIKARDDINSGSMFLEWCLL